MLQTKVVEKIKTQILRAIPFPQKSCHLGVKIWCSQADHRRQYSTCGLTKAIDAHLEYVILIAFPRHQWLSERTSILRLYIYCLSSGADLGFERPEACTILGAHFKKKKIQN